MTFPHLCPPPLLGSSLFFLLLTGPLVSDAHLAALAIEHGATLITSDRDFARFPDLRVEYPLLDS
jgi:predicted nucleic acid-binding protein